MSKMYVSQPQNYKLNQLKIPQQEVIQISAWAEPRSVWKKAIVLISN